MWNINPSVKFLTILVAALISAFSFSLKWNLVLLLFCLILMLASKVNMRRLLFVLIPTTVAACSLFFAIYQRGNFHTGGIQAAGHGFYAVLTQGADLSTALAVALRIYTYAFLGLLFALTTRKNEFVYSLMKQLKLKPKYAYGILAALNLLPVIQRELNQIRLAYKVRGYKVTPFSIKPLFTALVNTMHWSESLAMAMESKGFEEEGERTFYLQMRVKAGDLIWAAALIVPAVLGAAAI